MAQRHKRIERFRGGMSAETHVVSALRKKRAEVAGHVHDLEKKVVTWRARLAQIDETIKIFSPETDAEATAQADPPQGRVFQPGRVCAVVLGRAAKGDRPLTTAEIVASVIKAKGLPDNPAQSLTERTFAHIYGPSWQPLVLLKREKPKARAGHSRTVAVERRPLATVSPGYRSPCNRT